MMRKALKRRQFADEQLEQSYLKTSKTKPIRKLKPAVARGAGDLTANLQPINNSSLYDMLF
jgi:hypothetical protein